MNCKSSDIEMIVEAVMLDSKAIEEKYTENICKGHDKGKTWMI